MLTASAVCIYRCSKQITKTIIIISKFTVSQIKTKEKKR